MSIPKNLTHISSDPLPGPSKLFTFAFKQDVQTHLPAEVYKEGSCISYGAWSESSEFRSIFQDTV